MLTHITRISLIALLAGLLHLVSAPAASAASPTGAVEAISSPSPRTIRVQGWAQDPDHPTTPVTVRMDIGNTARDLGPADLPRSDLGGNYGFDATFAVPESGNLAYTVYAIDESAGAPETVIGEGRILVADTLTGGVESATSTVPNTVDVAGWASDSDAPTTPVDVRVYIGGNIETPGAEVHTLTANNRRDDGTMGFSGRLPTAKTGTQPVYVYAVNVPDTKGTDQRIGVAGVTIAVDKTPPQTKITSAPSTATAGDVTVTFSANEPDSTFECRWDLEPWATCKSPLTTKLAAGSHQLSVRATDQHGNRDQSPAVWVVKVTQAPDTPIPTNPDGTQTPAQAGRSIVAKAVKKKSRLRINVGPDSATTNYRVIIQRKVGKKWRKITRTRTRGPKDIVTINLKRGTYRAVLPKSSAGKAIRSNTIRLKR